MKIYVEGKQVGEVSYLTDTIESLLNIIETEEIWASREVERNPITKKKHHYVSLSRNLTSSASRNNKKWKYGVILNGDRLSDKYSITPFSIGGAMTPGSGRFKVKTLSSYTDGTCMLRIANWATTFEISTSLYNAIRRAIESMPNFEELQAPRYDAEGAEKKPYLAVINGGKRPNNQGKLIKHQYTFTAPNGMCPLNMNSLGDELTQLIKNPTMNETEERIWLKGTESVNISNCIAGVVLPQQEARVLKSNPELTPITQELDAKLREVAGNNYKVATY